MTPLAYSEQGSPAGLPVVLLHPIGVSGEIWALQRPALGRFRLLCVDLPGHGASSLEPGDATLAAFAARLAATLDAAGLSSAALVGLSLGGMVAQAFALTWPQRVSALVLAHTSARTAAPVAALWDERIAGVLADGPGPLVEATLQRWFSADFTAASPLTVDWVRHLLAQTSGEGLVAAMRAIQELDLLDRLGEISAPTLVVGGRFDLAAPLALAQEMAGVIASARLHVLDSGHIGAVEQPTAFSEAVGGFLQGVLT